MRRKTYKDISGVRFGKLVAKESRVIRKGNRWRTVWLCECDCGNMREIRGDALRNGKSKSCGCYAKTLLLKQQDASRKHGMYYTPEYKVLTSIKTRCFNPKAKHYENYGGRGIVVCKSWIDSVVNFVNDMGQRPSPKHSIERVDVNKHYCKENCIWAKNDVQQKNKRNSISLTFEGKTHSLREWSEKLNISLGTIEGRYARGMAIDQILAPTRINPWFRRRGYRNETGSER